MMFVVLELNIVITTYGFYVSWLTSGLRKFQLWMFQGCSVKRVIISQKPNDRSARALWGNGRRVFNYSEHRCSFPSGLTQSEDSGVFVSHPSIEEFPRTFAFMGIHRFQNLFTDEPGEISSVCCHFLFPHEAISETLLLLSQLVEALFVPRNLILLIFTANFH